jgi:hypothetical protein
VTHGQLAFEWQHLTSKVAVRDPAWHERLRGVAEPRPHPLFSIVEGDVEPWEKSVSARR